ncbi:hypothetical protein LWI28_010957 [Acer negundo]|uniref:Glutaredoxin domain-containing protein n=1 Tax=Acer negundo TaxID=4023 RepID=A0AAD5I9Y6_ACENE|nr:hypothetical protein LWI28_010957 [Acer negundo]KAK4836411.1 hypothetical protein QYF36_022621 [Acer negundo]
MWPQWLISPKRVHPRSKSFSCSSFKDIQTIIQDEPVPEPSSPRSPSVFHRARASTSFLRSWSHNKHVTILSPPPSLKLLPSKGIVVYFTSLRVIRKTYEECRAVRSILRGFRVPIDERDLSMDSKFLEELQVIMGCSISTKMSLPKVFIGGKYIGGAEEIRQLQENGELMNLIGRQPTVGPTCCDVCGGMRFVVCEVCNGSRKIYIEKHGFRTCSICNVNGLIRCPSCGPVHRRCTGN